MGQTAAQPAKVAASLRIMQAGREPSIETASKAASQPARQAGRFTSREVRSPTARKPVSRAEMTSARHLLTQAGSQRASHPAILVFNQPASHYFREPARLPGIQRDLQQAN